MMKEEAYMKLYMIIQLYPTVIFIEFEFFLKYVFQFD